MPPKKKKGQDQNQKEKAAKRQKEAADKTFGLRNKNKSAKVKAFVKQVEAQVNNINGESLQKIEAEQARIAAQKRAAEEARAAARKLLLEQQGEQKVPFGVDPKSVVCDLFKQGLCNKGKKCKFSHDLSIERKTEKVNLYLDKRDEKAEDTMDNWDEEKLRKVVLSKQGNPRTTTDKICKYFLQAVEDGKYGWFWVCPNGGDNCIYKHALPPGFKLKTKEEKRLERLKAAEEPEITLEEFIEHERALIGSNTTPVTEETFRKWKAERVEKRRVLEMKKKEQGKSALTGREIIESGKYQSLTDSTDTDPAWDLSKLRKETEAAELAEEKAENERRAAAVAAIAAANGPQTAAAV